MKRIILQLALLTACYVQANASRLWVAPFNIKAGETKAIDIYLTMDTEELYSALQFDLRLPEGLEVEREASGNLSFSLQTNRKAEADGCHSLTSNFADGYYTVVVSSSKNAFLKGTQGAVITMQVKASADLQIDKLAASVTGIKLGKISATSDDFASEPFIVTSMKELRLLLGANGYNTYACDHNFKMISGATAYTGAYSAGNVSLLEIPDEAVIPAAEGVMLIGNEGDNVVLLATGKDADILQGNDFVGVTRMTTNLKPGYNYVLESIDKDNFFAPAAKDESVETLMNKAYINVWEERPEIITINGNFPDGISIVTDDSGLNGTTVKYVKDRKVLIKNKEGIYTISGTKTP